MGELDDLFLRHQGRMVTKWRHYFEIYERHLAAFRGKPAVVLEFGVWHGGSLQLWRSWFGPAARIVGVDVRPDCARFAEAGTEIVIGDQADPATHRVLRERYGAFDVVIDDGGHTMAQQATTFAGIYPALRPGGVYIVEDTHSSYLSYFGGGLRREGTFIEQAKRIIDQQYGWFGQIPGLLPDELTRTAFGLHFYNSMVVIEKRDLATPTPVYRGEATMALDDREREFIAQMDEIRKREPTQT